MRLFRSFFGEKLKTTSAGGLAFGAFVLIGLGVGLGLGNSNAKSARGKAAGVSLRHATDIAEELDQGIAERVKMLRFVSHLSVAGGSESAAFGEVKRVYPEFDSIGWAKPGDVTPPRALRLTVKLENGRVLAGVLAPGWPNAILSETNDLGIDALGNLSTLVDPVQAYATAGGAAPTWSSVRRMSGRTAVYLRWSDRSRYLTCTARLKSPSVADLNLTVATAIPLDRLRELSDQGRLSGILMGLAFGFVPGAMAWFSIGRSTRRLRAANEALEQRVAVRTAELEAAERSFRSIFENAPLGLYQCDAAGRLLKVNPKLASIFGFANPEHLIAAMGSIQALGEASARATFLENVRRDGEAEATFSAVRQNGSTVWLAERARSIFGADGRLELVEGAVSDVTAQHALEDQLRKIGATDPLTGILNRRGLEEIVAQAEGPISFIVMDVDRFKAYNDRYGHLAGDLALQKVAEVLVDTMGEAGAVARTGGEEFVAVLSQADSGRAGRMAEALRQAVEACHAFETRLTLSAGVATAPSAESVAEAMAFADRALYLAKEQGRNRVSVNTVNLA